jgi:hypothetical protein
MVVVIILYNSGYLQQEIYFSRLFFLTFLFSLLVANKSDLLLFTSAIFLIYSILLNDALTPPPFSSSAMNN